MEMRNIYRGRVGREGDEFYLKTASLKGLWNTQKAISGLER